MATRATCRQLQTGITGFVDAFAAVPDTNGKYAGTMFQGNSAAVFTDDPGYIVGGPFKSDVNALTDPSRADPDRRRHRRRQGQHGQPDRRCAEGHVRPDRRLAQQAELA